jgi:hypothetical protein
MAADVVDLDPRVQQALQAVLADAESRGIHATLLSGARSKQDQEELYANYLAGQRGEPLPYPARGAVPLAARPGSSLHEGGLAFDLKADDPSQQAALWDIGHAHGLTTLGAKDPAHFQLANVLSNAATIGGKTSSLTDFIAQTESGNRNILQQIQDINTVKGTPAGGYFQIIDPTWRTYAKAAGVDAPYAMAANRAEQARVAAMIPLNQWGPNTVAGLKKMYPGIDLNDTLGQAEAKYAAGGGQGTQVAGAQPQGSVDWTQLLDTQPPPAVADLGSLLGGAAAGGGASQATPVGAGVDSGIDQAPPPADLAFAPASSLPEDISARYAAGKQARDLTPLGQLFTLKTIGQRQQKPNPYGGIA